MSFRSLLAASLIAVSALLGVQTPASAAAQGGGTIPPCNTPGDLCWHGTPPITCYMVSGGGHTIQCQQTCTNDGWSTPTGCVFKLSNGAFQAAPAVDSDAGFDDLY